MGAQGLAPAAIHDTVQKAYDAVNEMAEHHQRDPQRGLVDAGEFAEVARAFRDERARNPEAFAEALKELNGPDSHIFTTAGGPNAGEQVINLLNAIARGDDFATFNRHHQNALQAPVARGVRLQASPRPPIPRG
ncbi:MAG: hypothetical protein ACAI38_20955 [Myxococcota bacterium]|nr:hypothetical protein [Myxococcota bacterium]